MLAHQLLDLLLESFDSFRRHAPSVAWRDRASNSTPERLHDRGLETTMSVTW
jgi:hypothetical protein